MVKFLIAQRNGKIIHLFVLNADDSTPAGNHEYYELRQKDHNSSELHLLLNVNSPFL